MIPSEITKLRMELNELLESEPAITANKVAKEMGVSKGTLSKYRRGIYPGNNQMISDRLAEWMGSRRIAQEQLAGNVKQVWLTRQSPERIRIIRSRSALNKFLAEYPDACVITVWLGQKNVNDVFFSTGGGLIND